MKVDDRSNRPAPPPIVDTAEDTERLELVKGMACEIERRYGHLGPIALTGGGALRMAYGIQRPTYDLDLDTNKALPDPVGTLQKWCSGQPKWKNISMDRKQQGRGYIRARYETEEGTEWYTKVDLDTVGDNPQRAVRERELITLEGSGGRIRVQPVAAIVRRKIQKTFGERREGRDLYDLGWLLAKHPEGFATEHRVQIAQQLLKEISDGYDDWSEALKEDKAVQRANPDQILEAVWQTAANDPHLVKGEHPGSWIQIRGRSVTNGTADVVVVGHDGEPKAVVVGEMDLGEACKTVVRYGLKEKGEVLQIERTLEQSLAEARAMEKTRTIE